MLWSAFVQRLIFNSIFIFVSTTAGAQLTLAPVGARAAGLGNITTVETDVWSAVNNPAGLGATKDFGAGVFYEQRFVMAELGVSSIVGAFPVFGNGVGISLSNLRFSTYGQNRFGCSIGRLLGKFISLGVGVDAHLLRFPEDYQNLFAVTGNLGVWANPIKDLTLGFQVFNLTFSKWNDAEHSPLPVLFSLGACFAVATPVLLFAELSKDVYEAARIKFGTEFTVVKTLALRVGVISEPFETHFGMGYAYKNFRFDVALNRHPILGYTPQGGMSIKLNN